MRQKSKVSLSSSCHYLVQNFFCTRFTSLLRTRCCNIIIFFWSQSQTGLPTLWVSLCASTVLESIVIYQRSAKSSPYAWIAGKTPSSRCLHSAATFTLSSTGPVLAVTACLVLTFAMCDAVHAGGGQPCSKSHL